MADAQAKVPVSALHRAVIDAGRVDSLGNPCPRAIAEMCAVGIECDHGHDVCLECDPCTCERCATRDVGRA